MKAQYDVSHEDLLNIIRPSTPRIDPIVDVIIRLASPSSMEITKEEEKFLRSKNESITSWLPLREMRHTLLKI